MGADAHFIWPTHHLNYYTPTTIRDLMVRHGLDAGADRHRGSRYRGLHLVPPRGVGPKATTAWQRSRMSCSFSPTPACYGKNLRVIARNGRRQQRMRRFSSPRCTSRTSATSSRWCATLAARGHHVHLLAATKRKLRRSGARRAAGRRVSARHLGLDAVAGGGAVVPVRAEAARSRSTTCAFSIRATPRPEAAAAQHRAHAAHRPLADVRRRRPCSSGAAGGARAEVRSSA